MTNQEEEAAHTVALHLAEAFRWFQSTVRDRGTSIHEKLQLECAGNNDAFEAASVWVDYVYSIVELKEAAFGPIEEETEQ